MHSAALIIVALAGSTLATPHGHRHHARGAEVVTTVDYTVTVTRGGATPTAEPGVQRHLAEQPVVPVVQQAAAVPAVQQQAQPQNTGNTGNSGSTPTSTDSGSGDGASGWLLGWHNNYRSVHNVPAFVWDDSLASQAQSDADSCPEADLRSGSNWAGAEGLSLQAIVAQWYNEQDGYAQVSQGYTINPPSGGSGPIGPNGEEVGHFSQMMWKGSTKLGCGTATSCSKGMPTQITCLYGAPGNVEGEYVTNVLAPKPS